MSEPEKNAARVRRAAEHEHTGPGRLGDRRQSDTESAKAHPTLTDPKLRTGHPRGSDWRDKPMDSERDKDIKPGGGQR